MQVGGALHVRNPTPPATSHVTLLRRGSYTAAASPCPRAREGKKVARIACVHHLVILWVLSLPGNQTFQIGRGTDLQWQAVQRTPHYRNQLRVMSCQPKTGQFCSGENSFGEPRKVLGESRVGEKEKAIVVRKQSAKST
jgi:hypothetical protein